MYTSNRVVRNKFLIYFFVDFRRLETGHIKSLGKSAKSKKRPLSTAEEVEAKKSNTEATNSGSDHDAVEEDEFAERAWFFCFSSQISTDIHHVSNSSLQAYFVLFLYVDKRNSTSHLSFSWDLHKLRTNWKNLIHREE